MADNNFPQLVTQEQHGAGLGPPRTFEDALRDLVRNSPFLGISVLIHGVVFFIFYMMKTPVPVEDVGATITAAPEEQIEVIPPEPPPEEPEIEEIEEIIEDPVITEDVVTEVTEVVDSPNVDANFDSTNANDVIGLGAGAGGNFGGKVGRRGTAGKVAGTAHLKAVDDALKWLKNHQSPDGYWSANAFDDMCGQQGDGYCTGRGSPLHDVGVTGIALLAFLGAGNTDKAGRYKDVVKEGLRWLTKQQERNGNFGDAEINLHTYDHIIATLAVTEAFALTKQYKYKKSANNAIEYMMSLRNPGAAWRYADKASDEMVLYPNDTSVTGWAVLVLTLAKEYELDVDEGALEDSMLFIEEMTDPQNGRTGYFERGGTPSRPPGADQIWDYSLSESMTAVGVLCRIFVDPELSRPGNEEMIQKGVDLMLQTPIVWSDNEPGRIDFYYWYYATYALYQWGGKDWRDWEDSIVAVADAQVKEGEEKGSWDPSVDPWGSVGGRVYSTSILALLLEVYYRYDSVIGSH